MIIVALQFRVKWSHPKECPKVHEIYKVVSSTENLENYHQYLSVSFIIAKSLILILTYGS